MEIKLHSSEIKGSPTGQEGEQRQRKHTQSLTFQLTGTPQALPGAAWQ